MPDIEHEHIELRSEEVNEILSSTPKWIFRWGISVVFILIITAVGLSYFIRYPDVLTAQITLTTTNPPIKLNAKTNGKIKELLAINNAKVFANQTIAVLENTANYKHILLIDSLTNQLQTKLNTQDSLPQVNMPDSLKVGDVTPAYLSVLKSLKDIYLHNEINSYNRQAFLIQKDLANYKDLLLKYNTQEAIQKEQLSLVEKDYNRDQDLFKNKTISAREFEVKKREYLNAMSSFENFKITKSNTLMQVNSLEKNLLQLQIQDYEGRNKLKADLQQNLKVLANEVTRWKTSYLVYSPIAGKISFLGAWAVNQDVNTNDALFVVVPNVKQSFIGKCILPTGNTGKLALSQHVNIKLSNYPSNEYGILEGKVTNIAAVPVKDAYAIDVLLVDGLNTSYHKTLEYKEEMSGTADIITTNISVMDRVFFNFKKLIDKK